ncbi:MAG TPA: VWA domain-containing protein [Desulfobacteraceae bacterium]|nr:VWA domain-containing protein [Desulfobacteraceae bacterium]
MRRRTPITPFNLSFLDIMFCGFGAVVLLVLIINANTVSLRREKHQDRRAEAMRLELEVKAGREHLATLKNSLEETEREVNRARGRSAEAEAAIIAAGEELADLRRQTLAARDHVNALQADLKNMDSEHRRLGAEQAADLDRGRKVRRFEGEGNRQYLTGLKLGGRRVLLLVDASASMLDETIVNVIRRRNLDDASKRRAPKWRRAVQTAEWLIANLPPESSLQAYTFGTGVVPLAAGQGGTGTWVPVTDAEAVGGMITALRATTPAGGTSLENGLALIRNLNPPPDNVLLITDGLPTQGARQTSSTTVSGEKRIQLFEQAVKTLPRGIPVNTILFPMEGDPMAAVLFWRLAVETNGSFLTPTRDWP